MSAPKPCLGYRSRTAAVLALQAQGKSDAEIARTIGIPTKDVSALAASAARRGVSRSGQDDIDGILLSPELYTALCREAGPRNMSFARLANEILQAVVDDDLIDAVLDEDWRREIA